MAKFTPTEQRILQVLSDGKPHHKSEFYECLFDDMSVDKNKAVTNHVLRIREKLRVDGYDIVCSLRYRKSYYTHVRLLSTTVYDGK